MKKEDKPIKNKDFLLQFWNGYIRPLQDILPTLEDKRIIKAIEQLISANKLLEKDIKQLLSDKDEEHKEAMEEIIKSVPSGIKRNSNLVYKLIGEEDRI